MDALEFTDEEIREELARLGYQNVPSDKLAEFKKDLLNLIQSERSKTNSLHSSTEELRTPGSPFFEESAEYVSGNFTNHGSQWIEQGYHDQLRNKDGGQSDSSSKYREDWQYRGGDKTKHSKKSDMLDEKVSSKRPTTAPTSGRQRRAAPASFSNYELLHNVDKERTRKNENQSNMKDCFSHDDQTTKSIKRKTCRILQDGCRRVDESFCDSETEGIFEVYEKIKSMAMRDCECGKTKSTSSEEEPPYRLKGGKNDCPSVIIKNNLPPHVKNLVRQKPFERMKMYRKMWKLQPAAGEDNRTELHKQMHAKMMKKDEIKKAHKVYVPNLYQVPTLKARDNLRWKVRTAMESYEMPPHGFYHEI